MSKLGKRTAKVAVALSGAIALSTVSRTAEAAVFNVEYAGTIDALERFEPCTFAGCIDRVDPAEFYSSLSSFDSRQFGTVTVGDRFEGSYLFDDSTSAITANELTIGSSNAEFVFATSSGDTQSANFSATRRPGFDPDVANSLDPIERSFYESQFTTESETLSLDNTISEVRSSGPTALFAAPFLYKESFRGQPFPGQTFIDITAAGLFDQFTVTAVDEPEMPTNGNPSTDVPEPATALGLLALAGLLAFTRKD